MLFGKSGRPTLPCFEQHVLLFPQAKGSLTNRHTRGMHHGMYPWPPAAVQLYFRSYDYMGIDALCALAWRPGM